MGACLATAPKTLITVTDGGEAEYYKRFVEDQELGAGEFGTVKLVHEVSASSGKPEAPNSTNGQQQQQATPYASKVLKKGVVFKDNTLYTPIKPEVLQGEVEMLRALKGKHFCLHLEAIFESNRSIYLVTEFCAGGEMMEYLATLDSLRTEDVSRIAYQLLDGLAHCSRHGVIHRDIKPENVMFQDNSPQAELRLIDFGSGTMDKYPQGGAANDDELIVHNTFAGSAFYISPEMFQKTYTEKTDVWSAGATLYVLVAGYPSECLQKAFNVLQKSANRKIQELPNLPNNLPKSYYKFLDYCLTYRHKQRPSAREMRRHEFAQFHIAHNQGISVDEIAALAAAGGAFLAQGDKSSGRTTSIAIHGSADKHSLFLGFKKYERSLTQLLTTLLSRQELEVMVNIIMDRVKQHQLTAAETKLIQEEEEPDELKNLARDQKLAVLQVREVKSILRNDIGNFQAVESLEKLPAGNTYDGFAYHVYLLKQYASEDHDLGTNMGRKPPKGGTFKRSGSFRDDSSVGSSIRGSIRGSFRASRRK